MGNIVEKIKFQLHARLCDTMASLAKYFESIDLNKDGKLNTLEFEKFLSKIGIFLSTQELRNVYDTFDSNKDGMITFGEFIAVLRGDMTANRLSVVRHAFQLLDDRAQGFIEASVLLDRYRPELHPRVQTREKTPELIMDEFNQAMGIRVKNGIISEREFIEYYADINATLGKEREEYFIDMVMGTWGLKQEGGLPAGKIEALVTVIFEKTRQRTVGAEDEGKHMHKLFQYYDLDNSGALSIPEFKQVLTNLGCTFTALEIQSVFDYFDKDHSGKINMEEFCNIFALKGTGNNPNIAPKFKVQKEAPDQVLEKIKQTLTNRGTHGIRGLGIMFRRMDDSGDRKIDKYEFTWGLKENGHKLEPQEMDRLFKYFDRNSDGVINYDEFLVGIRGDMNERRQGLVMQVFQKLDKTGDGRVTIDDIKHSYNVEFHPKFKSGEMTKTEILSEFMDQWDRSKKDGIVTPAEFLDYYKDVSASVDRDDYFELMIRNAWHLAGGEGVCENTTIPRYLKTNPDGTQEVVMAEETDDFKYAENTSKFWGAEV